MTIWALVVGWLVFMGFMGPWLISAKSTEAVVLGFVIWGALGAYTYKVVKAKFNKQETVKQEEIK